MHGALHCAQEAAIPAATSLWCGIFLTSEACSERRTVCFSVRSGGGSQWAE
eukprot:SAG25_NODE_1138_length_3816_cov_4.312887_8_plen_51_part_00